MKTKIKGKLLLSLATLSLALVSSVGSTFAWFLISDKADLTGLDINVTTGSSVLLKDEDKSTTTEIYTNSFTIKPKDKAKWEMITPKTVTVDKSITDGKKSGTATTMTVAEGFQQVDISSTVSNKKWTYKAITAANGANPYSGTHVYGTTSTVAQTTSTTAYYYKVDFKYRVSTGYDVAVTIKDKSIIVTDKNGTKIDNPTETTQTVDKVVRVAFQDQEATTASVYRIAKTTETDYNAEQMNQLVKLDNNQKLEGDQYNCTLLNSDNKHKVTAPTSPTTTSDKAFYFGTTTMYVWYDGTDHACSNAVFEQTCSFSVEFSTVAQTDGQ